MKLEEENHPPPPPRSNVFSGGGWLADRLLTRVFFLSFLSYLADMIVAYVDTIVASLLEDAGDFVRRRTAAAFAARQMSGKALIFATEA